MGWAIGAGVKLNAPMIGAGDYFQTQVNYTEGATGYVSTASAVAYGGWNGTDFGYGYQADGVYGGTVAGGTATSIQLTTAWGVSRLIRTSWSKHVANVDIRLLCGVQI